MRGLRGPNAMSLIDTEPMDPETDYVMRLAALRHEPRRPPRPYDPGEHIFVQLWRDWLAGGQDPDEYPNQRFRQVLSDLERVEVSQRDATVAASLLCWLGTNVGQSYLRAAEDLARAMPHRPKEEAYLARWAIENRRCHWINNGVRTVEFLLMSQEQVVGVNAGWQHVRPWPSEIVEVTVRDLEVADAVAAWLGTAEGRR